MLRVRHKNSIARDAGNSTAESFAANCFKMTKQLGYSYLAKGEAFLSVYDDGRAYTEREQGACAWRSAAIARIW